MNYLLLLSLVACNNAKSDKPAGNDMQSIKDEAAVEFAQKELPALDAALASTDPGSASSICAVIKPDLKKIRAADAALADAVEKRCGHDLAIRSMTVGVEKAEAARKAEPTGVIFECSSRKSYEKMIAAAGADADPAVAPLRERWAAACPTKP